MRNLEQPSSDENSKKLDPIERIGELMDAGFLATMTEHSGGFRFAVDPKLPPGSLGYTNMETGVIYFNPHHLTEEANMTDAALSGFCFHEAGHHSPAALEFQGELRKDLEKPELIPEFIREQENPETEVKFFQALHSGLHNALADIWLESAMGRPGQILVQHSFDAMYNNPQGTLEKGEIPEGRDLHQFSKPDQLLQLLVGEARYGSTRELSELVDPEVHEAFQRIEESGALKQIQSAGQYFDHFGSENSKKASIHRKYQAYRKVFFKEWVGLIDSEFTDRMEKEDGSGQGESGDGEQSKSDGSEQGELGDGEGSETSQQSNDVMNDLLDELTKSGKERQSLAPSSEEVAKDKKAMEDMAKDAKQRAENAADGKFETPEPPKEKESAEDAMRKAAKKLLKESQQAEWVKEAEKYGVDPALIKEWERIKKSYSDEIHSTADLLSEILIDDRSYKTKYMQREGEIMDGLMAETYGELLSGNDEPETMMRQVRNPKFLQTEMEFIVDVSASMTGAPLERSKELLIILTEALQEVRDTLEGQQLLSPDDEQPLRLGATSFSDVTRRITTLEEPVSDKKQIQIINGLSQIGGGTEETEAISGIYKEMALHTDNVLKIMVVLTDGHGNRDKLQSILQQIQEDDSVVFLAVGLGTGAEGIVDSYVSGVRQGNQSNIFGFAADAPEDALPFVVEFIKQQVHKRYKS